MSSWGNRPTQPNPQPGWATPPAPRPPKKKPKWVIIGGILGAVIVIGAVGNAIGGGSDSTTSATGSTGTAPPAASSEPAASPMVSPSVKAEAETVTLPNFVGMGLQSAQDAAQEKGFYALDSHDSLGRARHQILDRDWKVCSQNYAAGKTVPADTTLDFGAVKLDETCPAKEKAAPTAAGDTMPNFVGESVKAARSALDSSTSITVNDASGDDRMVFVESNWQVCTQSPKAGATLNGQPVAFTAVKFSETCS
jgi:beta-lactam-binding protein with PASTA domain